MTVEDVAVVAAAVSVTVGTVSVSVTVVCVFVTDVFLSVFVLFTCKGNERMNDTRRQMNDY